jgi:hypothetical protein
LVGWGDASGRQRHRRDAEGAEKIYGKRFNTEFTEKSFEDKEKSSIAAETRGPQ